MIRQELDCSSKDTFGEDQRKVQRTDDELENSITALEDKLNKDRENTSMNIDEKYKLASKTMGNEFKRNIAQ